MLLFDKMNKTNPSREYLKALSLNERKVLATSLNIRQEYLYQIGAKLRHPSRELAFKLERETKGQIKESDFDEEIRVNIFPSSKKRAVE